MKKDKIIIKAEHVSFTYEDGTKGVRGIDLEIKEGKKIAVLGANGSGKSTFFLCLNGIHKPSSGRLFWEGVPYDYSRKGLLRLRSKVGIVFQDPDNQLLLSDILQEISFGVLNMGVDPGEAVKRAEEIAKEIGIWEFISQPTYSLSEGQKKQVSLADVMVMNPKVIILDEPAAALDPYHSHLIHSMADQMAEKGITVLISTHDVDFACEWADEAVLFHKGQVLAVGEPERIFSQINLLKQTHLDQPRAMAVALSLQKKGILPVEIGLPVSIQELEARIEAWKPDTLCGSKNDKAEKKGILVVSFGTSHEDTRRKTIEAIEKEIESVYTDSIVYRAWTSGMIIKKLKSRDHYHVDTVEQAAERMKKDGVTHVIVQPTHVVNGIENERMKEDILAFCHEFTSISFGSPLLTSSEDNEKVLKVLTEAFQGLPKDTALVFLGHGTTHYANAMYAALDYQLKDMGYKNVHIGTVEAYPSMETIKKKVAEDGYRRVILAPFMIVAGEHAKNDMAGDDKGSWKCQFEAIGCQVECVFKGLGEYEGIRQIFLEHVREARERAGL